MSGKAIIFSAPSGAGKTTIVHHLLKNIPELQFSISATTRKPRSNEIPGKDYHFLSLENFNKRIAHDDLLEWEEVYEGVKYGTLKSEVERIWNKGNAVIFDVDVVGGLNLKKQLGDKALSVFVKVKNIDTLKDRLSLRGTEESTTVEKRIEKALTEMTYEDQFDHVLINDNLETALSEAQDVVNNFLKQ